MPPLQYNLLTPLPDATASETTETLLTTPGVRLIRIVSQGQVSPAGFWYDQTEAEWVMVLSGHGRVAIEGEATDRILPPGEALFLPARCRHRVTLTSLTAPTVWLALFVTPDGITASAPAPLDTP